MDVSGQIYTPAPSPLEEDPRYPLKRELCGPRGPSVGPGGRLWAQGAVCGPRGPSVGPGGRLWAQGAVCGPRGTSVGPGGRLGALVKEEQWHLPELNRD